MSGVKNVGTLLQNKLGVRGMAGSSSLSPTSKVVKPATNSRVQVAEEDDDDEEDEDEDDSEEDEDSEDSGGEGFKPTAKISAKDLDWTPDEQQNVMKFYGLESLFPSKWVEDSAPQETLEQKPTEQKEFAIKRAKAAAAAEEDTSDPLQIKGKIKLPKYLKGREDVSIFISSKHFSPKLYLKEVHKSADYKELEQGLARLKQTIAERNETTKGLIKKHFAKFVNAKSTIDLFYKEMRAKNLISREDYGIAPFLKEAIQMENEAHALYGPVLERRAKADKIRITLSILEQWKFFFNLGSSIREMVRKGRYDAAVRDYKKGKSIMHSSFKNTLTPLELHKPIIRSHASFGKDDSNLLPKNYQSVFEKLWVEVERVVADFREELFKSLRIISNPIETQEKIISYLYDLDSRRDPVWSYLDSQYTWVLSSLVHVYSKHVVQMKSIAKALKNGDNIDLSKPRGSVGHLLSTDHLNAINAINEEEKYAKDLVNQFVCESTPWNLNDVKRALLTITTQQFEYNFGSDVLVQYWQQTLRFVRELCDVLETHLPAFWKTSKMYLDEKNHKGARKGTNQSRLRDTQSMLNNIFEIIQLMINYAFFLDVEEDDQSDDDEYSDEESVESSDEQTNSMLSPPILKNLDDYKSKQSLNELNEEELVWQTFQHLSDSLQRLSPKTFARMLKSHPLITIHFSTRIMEVFTDCINKTKPFCILEGGFTVMESLAATINIVRGCLVRKVCEGWVQVSNEIHNFEDWSFANYTLPTPNSLKPKNDSTYLMKISNKLLKFVIRALGIIVLGNHTSAAAEPPNYEANQEHIEKIKVSLFDSLFGIVDGFQQQIAFWKDPEAENKFDKSEGWVPDVHNEKLHTTLAESKYKFGQFVPPECAHFVEAVKPKDHKNLDVRCFMTLCNIEYLIEHTVPAIRDLFKDKFHEDIGLDMEHYITTCRYLERIIVMNYSKKQMKILGSLVKESILYSGIDWASLKGPLPIRPHCYQIMQHLIYVHATVSEVSKSLVPIVFTEILTGLAQELLMAYRQVDRFNIPGMLQATLETEFLDTTLKSFETQQSQDVFVAIYDVFERSADQEEVVNPEIMNKHLNLVKNYLDDAKEATLTQFRCFMNATQTAQMEMELEN